MKILAALARVVISGGKRIAVFVRTTSTLKLPVVLALQVTQTTQTASATVMLSLTAVTMLEESQATPQTVPALV